MNSTQTDPVKSCGSPELRIVLLGKNGAENSAVGNMILGRNGFTESSTRVSEVQRGRVEDRNISVIDTPGFFSTELTDEDLHTEMMKSLSLAHPGPHVFLLIIRPDTFTEPDVGKILKQIQGNFGKEAFKFTMVLFTGRKGMSKRDWIKFRLERKTRELLSYCEEKCYVINHEDKRDKNQISSLLENIDDIVKKNDREHSTTYLKTQKREEMKPQGGKDRMEKKTVISLGNEKMADSTRYECLVRNKKYSVQKGQRIIHESYEACRADRRSPHTDRCLTSEEENVEAENNSITEVRIVLMGKSGAAKSSTGNTILGRDVFTVNKRFLSAAETCEKQAAEVCGKNILVVKTPGLIDSSVTEEKVKSEVQKCVQMSVPGPHAFLLVIRLDVRFTEGEMNAVKWIQENFGEDAACYTIVLFTHGDHLWSKSLDEYITEGSDLQKLIDSCGGRYHLLNNEDIENRSQVTQLLEKIEQMVMRNGGKHHTDEICMFQEKIEKTTQTNRGKLLQGILIFLIGALAAAAVATNGLKE